MRKIKRVLLVVDMINDFIDPAGVLSLQEAGFEIVPVIKQKIVDARAEGDIIIYLRDWHQEDDAEFQRFPKHAVMNTWGSEIIEELLIPSEPIIVNKTRYSGFYNTRLGEWLNFFQPEEVEVVGCCTSICVAQTIADLANRDYKVVVDRKAVADFNQEAHNFYINYQLPNIFGVEIK